MKVKVRRSNERRGLHSQLTSIHQTTDNAPTPRLTLFLAVSFLNASVTPRNTVRGTEEQESHDKRTEVRAKRENTYMKTTDEKRTKDWIGRSVYR